MAETKRARAIGVNHVALEVGDIEEAVAFYGRLFEFTLRGKSEYAAFIDLGDQFLALQKGRKQPSVRDGTLADWRPHAARDRLQADAMLIRRPDLDRGAGMLAPLIGGGALQFFLSVHDPARSLPAGVADAAAGSTSQVPPAHPSRAGRAPT